MKISTLLIICFLFLNGKSFAQNYNQGSLMIIQDPRVDSLMELSKRNPAYQTIEGYRIQIFMESGNEAVNRANETIAKFHENYPEIPAYLTFGQPYYRVRVGDFRTRLEAEGKLRFIINQYSNAFITKDMIGSPQLISFPTNTIQP